MEPPSAHLAAHHRRARQRGAQPVVYWVVRSALQLAFHVWLRFERIGREHVPASGPCILAANHRSFLDPFVIGMLARRPVYYVAKQELFRSRPVGWLLNALGAFPVRRGESDADMLETARAVLARGDVLVMFPEGTRIRRGPLGTPRRGVARLALESGVPVVPVAVHGSEDVRRGWRIRPRKVRVRAGRPLTFPRVEHPSPRLARAVTERVWPCVELQWEWLGGTPALHRAVVVGAGAWGTALAAALDRAGLDVQLVARGAERADVLEAAGENERHLPGVPLGGVRVVPASGVSFDGVDLVVLAVPARALPAALAAHRQHLPRGAGVLVCAKGLVAPQGAPATEFVAGHLPGHPVACLGGPAHARDALDTGASVVVGTADAVFGAQVRRALTEAGLQAQCSADVVGVDLAGVAKNAAALAAAAAVGTGPNAAGAAAAGVFDEVAAWACASGADPRTFTGPAGVGDLVATVLATGSRNRRAGELLASGIPAGEIGTSLGQTAEALDLVPLLAARLRAERRTAPAVGALAELVEGRLAPGTWSGAQVTPRGRGAA